MITHDSRASFAVYLCLDCIANLDCAACHITDVKVHAVGLLCIKNGSRSVGGADSTLVTYLTAALSVEGSLIENECELALIHLVHAVIVNDDSKHLCIGKVFAIADELSLLDTRKQILGGCRPTADISSCGSRALSLLLHKGLEGLLVDAQTLFLDDFSCKVKRESKGIVKLEHVLARNHIFTSLYSIVDYCIEDIKTRVDSSVESLFLVAYYLKYISLLFAKLGVRTDILTDNHLAKLAKKCAVNAEKLTEAASAAKDSTKDISSALVRGDNAVAYHKRSASDMVGNNADRDIVLGVVSVALARNSANSIKYLSYGIYLKEVVHALHYASKTLKTHTRIYILLNKLCVVAVSVVIELGEHVVPDLHKAVTVATRLTVGRAAAVLLAAVKINLRARTAGPRAVLPEVICLTEAHDTLRRNAYLLVPYFKGFLVVLIDRGPKKLTRNFKPFGKEFPRPRNSLVLEVIAK